MAAKSASAGMLNATSGNCSLKTSPPSVHGLRRPAEWSIGIREDTHRAVAGGLDLFYRPVQPVGVRHETHQVVLSYAVLQERHVADPGQILANPCCPQPFRVEGQPVLPWYEPEPARNHGVSFQAEPTHAQIADEMRAWINKHEGKSSYSSHLNNSGCFAASDWRRGRSAA
jgi:hypothetical protein